MAWAVAIFGAVLISAYVFQIIRSLRYLWHVMRGHTLIDRYSAGQCLHCGYDLTGNVTGVCPECGAGFV